MTAGEARAKICRVIMRSFFPLLFVAVLLVISSCSTSKYSSSPVGDDVHASGQTVTDNEWNKHHLNQYDLKHDALPPVQADSLPGEYSFNLEKERELLSNESTELYKIRLVYSDVFYEIVTKDKTELIDSIFSVPYNQTLYLISKKDQHLLPVIHTSTLEKLSHCYQEGYFIDLPRHLDQYVYQILYTLLPEDLCKTYGFRFRYINELYKLFNAMTFSFSGEIQLQTNLFDLIPEVKENYLAYLIAHEVAHSLLLNKFPGRMLEDMCDKLACMLLQHAGYSLSGFYESRNIDRQKDYFLQLWGAPFQNKKYTQWNTETQKIFQLFSFYNGQETLIDENLFDEFRKLCIIKSNIVNPSPGEYNLKFNLVESFVNYLKYPDEEQWQVIMLENLRKLLLLGYVDPKDVCLLPYISKMMIKQMTHDEKKKLRRQELSVFEIVKYSGFDIKLNVTQELKQTITYGDFFNYLLNIPLENDKLFVSSRFLYEQSLTESDNPKRKLYFHVLPRDTINLMFVHSLGDIFNKETADLSNILELHDSNCRLFINESFTSTDYYAITQTFSLLRYAQFSFNQIKYFSTSTFDFYNENRYTEINFRIVYGNKITDVHIDSYNNRISEKTRRRSSESTSQQSLQKIAKMKFNSGKREKSYKI